MAKETARIEAARKAYREALDAARGQPSAEAWARLLAAGKELSAAEAPRSSSRGRRSPRAKPVAEPTGEGVEATVLGVEPTVEEAEPTVEGIEE
jgi:hypothetical protein